MFSFMIFLRVSILPRTPLTLNFQKLITDIKTFISSKIKANMASEYLAYKDFVTVLFDNALFVNN